MERLALMNVDLQDIIEDDDADDDDGSLDPTPMIEAIASLPRLSALSLRLEPRNPIDSLKHPASPLAALGGRLTSLHLPSFALDDFALIGLVCALTNLRSLNVLGNHGVRDACMPAVAALLPNLSQLNLCDTGVTDAGVEYLSQLKGLAGLWVPKRVSHEAAQKALRCDGDVRICDRFHGRVLLL